MDRAEKIKLLIENEKKSKENLTRILCESPSLKMRALNHDAIGQ